jgi:hypothetical protein
MTDFDIIAEFRASGGRVGGSFQGSDILLLHHTGHAAGYEVKAAPGRIPVVVLDPVR